jgi:hypothetical protein
MEVMTLHLFKADDAEDSFAIKVAGDSSYRGRRGFGQQFKNVWSLEIQSEQKPDLVFVDWDKMLDRAVEAYEMSDPVLTNFDWNNPATPLQQ